MGEKQMRRESNSQTQANRIQKNYQRLIGLLLAGLVFLPRRHGL